ncbi:hypothetical protein GOP47_0006903 [Adiantum capillus-veneris]|uniref:ER membrane protein complex subunit 10 n=1 Tax=Adiantum capillus-veneris TaxID=13818 RepID=A0A9D4V4Q3_ADICA|nr:hypothetical protein GOP47_0006598 [Adiantum capillus-veneris]KAI5079232.1 hypothetical protein GOP47_0006903 [Adiantum capillus-veneris]
MVPSSRALLLVLTLLSLCSIIAAFQSDELQEEDDEWGIIGAKNNNNNNNNDHLEQVTARSPRRPSQVSTSDGSPSSSDTKVAFQLEHSFGDSADFGPAGTFTARLRNLHHGGQTLTKLRLTRNAFTTKEEEAFQTLVEEDGFYRVRMPANVLSPGQDTILSSVKARCLAAVNLQERFEFYMDRGIIIAVAYGASDCAYPRDLKFPTKWTFDSHIVMKSGEQAARSLVVNNEVEVELGEDGQPKVPVEKTFWQKYWLYIVPLVFIVLNVVTQAANMPDESASQSGAPQRAVSSGPRRR